MGYRVRSDMYGKCARSVGIRVFVQVENILGTIDVGWMLTANGCREKKELSAWRRCPKIFEAEVAKSRVYCTV